jgi:hypothetical protein
VQQAKDDMRLGGGSAVFRALKVTILLVMLAAAGVSAGMAYKLGALAAICAAMRSTDGGG